MAKPPMSEIFDAMARGVLEPYHGSPYQQQQQQQTGFSGSFDGRSYDAAKQQAGIYRAIAEVYRKYEAQED